MSNQELGHVKDVRALLMTTLIGCAITVAAYSTFIPIRWVCLRYVTRMTVLGKEL